MEECISHLCEYITNKGPFDGLLGFSQGATLSALLAGYQSQGKVLKDHPPIKLVISISGSKFRTHEICDVAYKNPIKAKSVHFIGEKDWLKLPSEDLATAFHDPLIIRHPQGHTVPRLDEGVTEQLLNWIKEVLEQNDMQNGKREIEEKKVEEELCEDAKAEKPNQEEVIVQL